MVMSDSLSWLVVIVAQCIDPYALSISAWFLKNQVWRTGFLTCKNQFQNWFLQDKQAVKIQFVEFDFSSLIFQKSSTRALKPRTFSLISSIVLSYASLQDIRWIMPGLYEPGRGAMQREVADYAHHRHITTHSHELKNFQTFLRSWIQYANASPRLKRILNCHERCPKFPSTVNIFLALIYYACVTVSGLYCKLDTLFSWLLY